MKIAAVIYKFFPYGGAQLDFLRIIDECHERGHHVSVYTSKWEGECPNFVELHTVLLSARSNHGRMAEFGEIVQKLLAEADCDIVFSVNRLPGIDVYFAADNCYAAKADNERGPFYKLTPRYRTYRRLEEAVFGEKSATKIMLLMPNQMKDFIKYYKTLPERFMVLPPGIPPDRCRPDNADELRKAKRAELNVSDQEIMILQIGSGFATKGVDRSLKAIASLPMGWRSRVRFFVVGRDNPAKFAALSAKLHILNHVEFLGGRNDVPELLLAADLMLHPAVNDAGAGVLAEAIVAGLPALCSAACGFAPLIAQAHSGVVIPEPFDQELLNLKLEKMLETPVQLQAYQDNAIMYAGSADFFRRQSVAVDFIELAAGEKRRKE